MKSTLQRVINKKKQSMFTLYILANLKPESLIMLRWVYEGVSKMSEKCLCICKLYINEGLLSFLCSIYILYLRFSLWEILLYLEITFK